jgi:hypothetical protein
MPPDVPPDIKHHFRITRFREFNSTRQRPAVRDLVFRKRLRGPCVCTLFIQVCGRFCNPLLLGLRQRLRPFVANPNLVIRRRRLPIVVAVAKAGPAFGIFKKAHGHHRLGPLLLEFVRSVGNAARAALNLSRRLASPLNAKSVASSRTSPRVLRVVWREHAEVARRRSGLACPARPIYQILCCPSGKSRQRTVQHPTRKYSSFVLAQISSSLRGLTR